jgi:2-polyprenyl-3-methyl-5-hydroxy-6-metoxy-1,4-benzoquinol methylase
MSRIDELELASKAERSVNPYRAAFYHRQAEWHRYEGPEHVRGRHEVRARYYEWYTRGWLPEDRDTPILDIACGSGQFLYFLRKKGYTNIRGIDLDHAQVEIGQALGLDVVEASAFDHLDRSRGGYGLIAMLDIIEHFTREELFPLMEIVVRSLRPGGRLIASVPNAESPTGLGCYFADITHEMSFTPGSFEEMLFCHRLKLAELRDPWPVPLDAKRRIYYWLVRGMRTLEGLRLRSLGFEPPRIWSNVLWAMAMKESR